MPAPAARAQPPASRGALATLAHFVQYRGCEQALAAAPARGEGMDIGLSGRPRADAWRDAAALACARAPLAAGVGRARRSQLTFREPRH
jgi:hypothetical protein